MQTHRIVFFIFLFTLYYTVSSSQHLKTETWYDHTKTILKESYYVLKNNTKVLDSTYTSYYHNGKIKSIGNYKKNKAEGLWEYFYENGNLRMRGNMEGNIAQGRWEYYYENGGLNMEGEVDKGIREGEWKFYYENGTVKSVGEYSKNMKQGVWTYFHEDGSYKAQVVFGNDKGKYTELYPSGTIKSEGEIAGGKSNGIWKYYHENSQLSAEGENKEGQKDGQWKLYYKDGTFKAEGNFKKGDGYYKEYYESGKLKIEGKVMQDKNEGEWKYYYENGALEGTCFFVEGKGHYTGYYENKKLKMEGEIENGKKVGIWKLYNANGQLTGYYKTYYENDVPVFVPLEKMPKDTLRSDSIKPIEKPDVKLPKKRSRHYTRKVNEYKDFIVMIQPLGLLRNQFPLSMEYYYQERLGLEVNYTLLRDPFFESVSSLPMNAVSKRGFSTYFRQKLYQKDQDNGMYYWAQELRFTSLDYSVNTLDTTGGALLLRANEKLYELSILIGDRVLRDARKKGWTIDIFAGLGIGYRSVSRNFQREAKKDALFLGLKTRNYTIPFRIGFSVGYLF